MSAQMALLGGGKWSSVADLEEPSVSTAPVTCKGMPGQLRIAAGTGVSFSVYERKEASSPPLLQCCSPGPAPLEVKQEDLIGGAVVSKTVFQVWYCRHDGRKPERIIRRRCKSAEMVCTTESTAAQVVQLLCRRLCKSARMVSATEKGAAQAVQALRDAALSGRKDAQRRLLIVVNPCSGRGKARKTFTKHVIPILESRARKIFTKHVRPILEAAGFHMDVRETQGPGHATDIVKEAELQNFDAVVAVGGDGTIFEILQGYFHGDDWGQRVKTPFCLVPSGSGNALAANCGLWTPETAAFAICKGRTRSLDIFSVVQPPSRRYFAFLSIYYGMMANLDHGTDHLRWMGSMRFTLGAILEVLKHCRYAATVAYLPTASSRPASQDSARADSIALENSRSAPDTASTAHSSSNADRQSKQQLCQSNGHSAAANSGSTIHSSSYADGQSDQQIHNRKDHSAGATPGSCSSAGPSLRLLQALGPEDELKLGSIAEMHPGWQLLTPKETSFFAAVNLPMLDFHSHTGPEADFNSGCLDIVYVPEIANRKQGLEWLDLLGKGKHLEGNLTHLKKACAMIIEPYSSGTSLVVDGEAVPYKRVYLEVHPSLCNAIVA